jgi:O-antigen/teichoic acid export membrane protein
MMVAATKGLTRRMFGGGAAGDAGSAGGRAIASNVIVQLLARAITMAISVVTVSLTARTLDPAGFGVWSGISSYVGLFAILTDLGFMNAAMLRMSGEPERESEWLGALMIAKIALAALAALLCLGSIPLLLSGAGHRHEVAVIFTLTIPTAAAGALMSVFQSRLRVGLMVALSVLQSALWLVGVVALAVEHASVVPFAAVYVSLALLIAALQVYVTRKHVAIAWRAGLGLLRALARVAIPLGLAGVMIVIYFQIDSVLLLQIAGAKEAGIYGAAYAFLGPLMFLPAAVTSSLFPVVSAVYERDPERVRRLVQVAADIMAVISLPVLAGTIALSGPIVRLLYGSTFHRSAGVLPILMIAFVSICFGTLAGTLAPLLGRQWRLAIYSTVGAVANVILNLVLIPPYGAFGSAWATVATEVLTMMLMVFTSMQALRLRLRPWKILGVVALATAMTGVMVLARPLGLVPAGALGVGLFAAGTARLRIVDFASLRALRAAG